MEDKKSEELDLRETQDQVIELNEAPKIEMTKEERGAFEKVQQKKTLITMIVGVSLNVFSLAIVLFPIFAVTKSTCKELTSCGAVWGVPFVFIPAAAAITAYASWICTFIYWHEKTMHPNGEMKRDVPKKLKGTIMVVNGFLSVIFLVVAMAVLFNQTQAV
jgi:cell division protein FtsL